MIVANSNLNQLSNNTFPLFKSELTNGKILRVLGTPSEPYFVAKDIATMLNYNDTSRAIKLHIDKEDKITCKQFKKNISDDLSTHKLQGHTQLINESGLYSLILRSNKPIAKKFKRWVTSDVLPNIRKTGEYKINQQLIELQETNRQLEETNGQLEFSKKQLEETNGYLKTDLRVIQNELIMSYCKAFQKYSCVEQYYGKNIVYLIYIGIHDGKYLFKIGKSDDFEQRWKSHKQTFAVCELMDVRSCVNALFTERLIKKYLKDKGLMTDYEVKGDIQKEVFECSDKKELNDFIDHFKYLTQYDTHITELEYKNKILLLEKEKEILKLRQMVDSFKHYLMFQEMSKKDIELEVKKNKNKDYPYCQKMCFYCYEYYMTDNIFSFRCERCEDACEDVCKGVKMCEGVKK